MPDIPRNPNALRMIKCYFCGASNFVPPEYAPGAAMPCTKCGKDILVPFMLRHFEVRQAIASGGMGTVYRAFDTVLQRDVAVKLMKPELAADPQKLDEFYREAKAIAALNHPHIIQVFHFGEFEGQNFIAMELADRGSLEDRIKEKGKVTELEVLDVGVKIGQALGYALSRDLIHRDLKPANILFNAAGEPKLVDWGLATKTDATAEWGSDEIWGTPEYVAPEKVRREGETFHADMYSLGATLYQAITGHVPFECDNIQDTVNAHVSQPVRPPKELVPEISEATNEAILKTLAKFPKERFETYDEMAMAFTSARSQLLVSKLVAENPAPAEEKPRGRTTRSLGRAAGAAGAMGAADAAEPASRGRGVMLGAGAVAVVAVLAAVYFLFLRPSSEPSASTGEPSPATNEVAAVTPMPVTNAAPVEPATNAPVLKPLPVIPRPQISTPFINLADANATNYWRGFGLGGKGFPTNTWKFSAGTLSVISTNRSLILIKERYIDFELTFEWRADAETRAQLIYALNEGITNATSAALRIPLVGDESGIQGGAAGRNSSGSLSGLLASTNKTLKPLGQFNATRIVVFKDKTEIWINQHKVNEFALNSARFKEALDKSPKTRENPYFGKTTSGFVGFQPSPGFAIRNIRIRAVAEYPPPPKVVPVVAPPSVPTSKKRK